MRVAQRAGLQKGREAVFKSPRRAAYIALTAVATLVPATVTSVVSAGPAAAADTATVNGAITYQTMTGFGISEAFGQAASVMNAPSGEQQQVMSLLFDPNTGAGLDILRNEISADPGSTIEPNNPGSPSAAPNYLSLASINQDQGQLWFAQRMKSSYGLTNVFADAWSAPGFMKTNGSQDNGGTLCGAPGASCSSGDWRQAYANYLVQYAKDYAAAGVPLTFVGPENEANLSTGYDSMLLTPSQTANLLDVLGPAVASSGLSTQVECCATEGWDYAQQYAAGIDADSTASSYTKVFGSHGYTQAPNSPLNGWAKPAWETEWYGSGNSSWNSAWDDGTDASGFSWAQNIYNGLVNARLSAFLFWYGTVTQGGGNGALLMLNSNSTVSVASRLWAFANYSRFIRPGAVRIGATSSTNAVEIAAFKNSNGTVAITALNTSSSADPITYSLSGTGVSNGATVTPYVTNASNNTAVQATTSVGNGSFTAIVPARSLVTYVIPGSTANGNTVTVTNPGNQTGTVGTPIAGLQIHASDSAAGQTLTYTARGLPAGLSLSSSGLITGTPTTAGTSSVTVTATDTTGASGSASFTWSVSPAAGNTVTVTNPGSQTGTVGTAISGLQVHASDSAAGQTLTYSATGLPAGLSISSSGLISGTPTTAGTSTATVTATDTTGATGTATFPWTITGTTGGGFCHIVYAKTSEWPGGFTANVTIDNSGTTTINGWTLTSTFPGDQKITNAWNAATTQSGEAVMATNLSYDATIAPGGNTSFGFQGTWVSNDTSPTEFTLNGTACS
jgi:O-glycosyl hydrolase